MMSWISICPRSLVFLFLRHKVTVSLGVTLKTSCSKALVWLVAHGLAHEPASAIQRLRPKWKNGFSRWITEKRLSQSNKVGSSSFWTLLGGEVDLTCLVEKLISWQAALYQHIFFPRPWLNPLEKSLCALRLHEGSGLEHGTWMHMAQCVARHGNNSEEIDTVFWVLSLGPFALSLKARIPRCGMRRAPPQKFMCWRGLGRCWEHPIPKS